MYTFSTMLLLRNKFFTLYSNNDFSLYPWTTRGCQQYKTAEFCHGNSKLHFCQDMSQVHFVSAINTSVHLALHLKPSIHFSDFNQICIFLNRFSCKSPINFMKMRLEGTALMYADRQTDKHDEANRRIFSYLRERTLKSFRPLTFVPSLLSSIVSSQRQYTRRNKKKLSTPTDVSSLPKDMRLYFSQF